MVSKILATVTDLVRRGIGHTGFALTHLMPRRRALWAFGSWQGQRFADNARYMFLYCAQVPPPRATVCMDLVEQKDRHRAA
jgi:hypothetical protein